MPAFSLTLAFWGQHLAHVGRASTPLSSSTKEPQTILIAEQELFSQIQCPLKNLSPRTSAQPWDLGGQVVGNTRQISKQRPLKLHML